MQLLIVHRDPEMGEALVQMVKSYTRHHCQLVPTESAAMEWARRHQRCDLLLTQLEAEGINGLTLGSALSEIFPGLQVLFFPNYGAADRRLEVADTKVFPEPIEGDDLLTAIERAEKTQTDAPDLFHVIDVLQMCCLSRRSGAVQMVKDGKNGLVLLRSGKIVHAETTVARGRGALFEMVAWKHVEFAYERSVRPPLETITSTWHEVLIEAVTAHKEDAGSRCQSA
jgi:DNA-binding NarL/FixJ family response regulator